jgi:DNA-binding FadR family transcriptional regulator
MRSSPGTGLVDRVYREILGSIVAGEFKEGDQLPTEQALTLRFAASRPTIREALSRLRADGITSTRRGAGTFVTRRPDPDLPRFAPLETLSDLQRCFDFRIVVESGAAALAATMDRLAEDAIARDPARFATLLQGREGMGGIYDIWRKARAALRGERFDPRHHPAEGPR